MKIKITPSVQTTDFDLWSDIKHHPLYKAPVTQRDINARRAINENSTGQGASNIMPGELISFKYYEPKTKEELEYYDAQPVTIFFGIFESKEGKRILGFNIHYYPPKMRYRIMSTIFDIYRPVLMKYFESGMTKEIDAFDYKYLVDQLSKSQLDFGVRMYIPSLCGEPKQIAPNMWSTAVFTEGVFRKQTREQILSYWSAPERFMRLLGIRKKRKRKKR